MNFSESIREMLSSYPKEIPEIDKLREILQQTALLGLARHHFFEHAAFYGGTALRILYRLDRYSEDLDFSLLNPKKEFHFAPFLHGMQKELAAFGFELDVSIREKNHETAVQSAFLKGNTLTLLLSIMEQSRGSGIHPEQKIQIKLEIDTEPPPFQAELETRLVKNPIPFYVTTYAPPDLFAGKMHATLCRNWKNRVKGRDWYDTVWYLQKETPLALEHLRARMVQSGHLKLEEPFGKKELLEKFEEKVYSIDWELAKRDVAPFITDQNRLSLWSPRFFLDMIKDLKISTLSLS